MKRRKSVRRCGRGEGMMVMSRQPPAQAPGVGTRRGRREAGRGRAERRWSALERRALARLERDIERGWAASERGIASGGGGNPAWMDAWRRLAALVEGEGGPTFEDVVAVSLSVEGFVEAFVGQLAMVVGLPPAEGHVVAPAWSEWLAEVTAKLLGPFASWFPAERSEHQRLHAMALLRSGRRPEAARFIEAWREGAPGDVFAWLATSRLHCEPLRSASVSGEDARHASRVLERGLEHCRDPLGRSLLWAELHSVYHQLGDVPRREAAWQRLMGLVH